MEICRLFVLMAIFFTNKSDCQFTATPGTISACENANVILTWNIKDYTSVSTVQWKKHGTIIMSQFGSGTPRLSAGVTNVEHGGDGAIVIKGVQTMDTGEYSCHITYTPVSSNVASSSTAYINVIRGHGHITFDPPQVEYEAVENTILPSINCTASCYPACTYTWKKIGKTGQIGVDGVLNLRYLERSMAGIYRCTSTGTNQGCGSGFRSMITRDLSLHVIYGPDSAAISDGHSLTLTEGTQHTKITCTSDCYPSCISSWTSITNGAADVSGDDLSLGRVTRNQTGKYKCTTSNTAPEYQSTAEATIDITVYYAPEITALKFPNSAWVENNYAELNCNANGVPSNYNYIALTQTWRSVTIRNTRPPISAMPLHSSIRFDALRLEDTGTYTCVVNNGVRDVGGILDQVNSTEICVEVSPKMLHQETTFVGAISGFVRISVPFYSFPPTDNISFTRQDGTQIQNSYRTTVSYELSPVMTKFYGEYVILNGSIAYLQITDIQETDLTKYTLDVTNSIGQTRIVISLIAHKTTLNTGPVVGGVVGSVIALAMVIVVAVFLFRRRNGKLRSNEMSPNGNNQVPQEGPYTSMQNSTGNESEYLEINRERERSTNRNNQASQEGPYTSMQYSTGNENEYLEINREQGEQGQQQTGDRKMYVNLQLNVQ